MSKNESAIFPGKEMLIPKISDLCTFEFFRGDSANRYFLKLVLRQVQYIVSVIMREETTRFYTYIGSDDFFFLFFSGKVLFTLNFFFRSSVQSEGELHHRTAKV